MPDESAICKLAEALHQNIRQCRVVGDHDKGICAENEAAVDATVLELHCTQLVGWRKVRRRAIDQKRAGAVRDTGTGEHPVTILLIADYSSCDEDER